MLISADVYAQDGVKRFFAHLEYWGGEDAYEKDKDVLRDLVTASGGRGSSQVDGTAGLRAGVFFPSRAQGLELGGSLGLVPGPDSKFSVIDGPDSIIAENEIVFWRALFELQKRFRLSRRTEIRAKGGLGLAAGRREEDTRTTGSVAAGIAGTDSERWTGVTWELGPSFAVIGEKVTFEIGLVYGDFPKLKQTDDLPGFDWNPLGLRLGLEF